VFFHYVIKGLKGEAADRETGEVGWEELVVYVRRNVDRSARQWFPAEAERRGNRPLQTPHHLGNLIAAPVLARATLRVAIPEPRVDAKLITSKSSGIKLALIPAGEFMMGSDAGDADAEDDEFVDKEGGRKEKHRVRITRPYYLGVTEVTQGQYRAVTGESPSDFNGSDDLPVEKVSWNDAIRFCNKLSERDGLVPYYKFGAGEVSGGDGYRLPTEAEWEYACRGGRSTRYSFGDDASELGDHAWFGGNSDKKTHAVGQKRPNGFGLYDMHGNVWEWCWDYYKSDYYKDSPVDDPVCVFKASSRVYRGGGWDYSPRNARSANRSRLVPGDRGYVLGFRVALGRSGL
jgi:formylglycine-generating enzyme required for sulfatase activity